MLLSGISIFLWIIEYDIFVENILHFYGKKDKIAVFKSQYLSADKFQIIRYISIVISFLFCISIPFLEQKIRPLFVLSQNILAQVLQSIKGIHTELLGLSQIEKYWFWGSFIGFTLLKIYFLTLLPLFVDEAFSYIYFVNKGFLVTMTYYPGPNNHVAYNLIANCFDLFSLSGIWVMRLPSLIISMMTFILLFVFVKRGSNFFTAISTVWILNTFFSYNYYSVSGRGYILYVLCFVCTIYALHQSIITKKQYYVVFYGMFSIIGLCTIPTFVYPVVSCFIIGIISISNKRKWIQYHLCIFVGTIIFYTPIILINGLKSLIGNNWVKSLNFSEFLNRFGSYILNSYDWLWNLEELSIGIIFSTVLIVVVSIQYYKSSPKIIFVSLFFALPFCILFFQKVLPFPRIWIYLLPLQSLLLALFFNKIISYSNQKIRLLLLFVFTIFGAFIIWNEEFKNGFGIYDEIPKVIKLLSKKEAKKVFIEEDTYNVIAKYYFLQNQNDIEIDVNKYEPHKEYDFILLKHNSHKKIEQKYELVLQNTSIQVYKRLK